MKNLFIFSILFLGFAVFSFGQTNLSLKFIPKDGKVFTKENELFVATFSIVGLNSDKESDNFKTTMRANAIVNHFEIAPKVKGQSEYQATLKLTKKGKEVMVPLLKSVNVTTLIVNNKSYTLDQFDQISKDLKPKSEGKEKSKTDVKEKPKTVSGQ